MLLPSPFPCEARRPSLQRFTQYSGRSWSVSPAPEPSPVSRSSSRSRNDDSNPSLSSTCRALHTLLGLQTPSTTPTSKRRTTTPLRPAPTKTNARVVKRPPLPPRGRNKRNRDVYEAEETDWAHDRHGGRKYANDSSVAHGLFEPVQQEREDQENLTSIPSTPKRQCRRAPAHIPFGLERADFYDLMETPPAAEDCEAQGQLPIVGDTGLHDEDMVTTPKQQVRRSAPSTPRSPHTIAQQISPSSTGINHTTTPPGSRTPRPTPTEPLRRSPRINMNFSVAPILTPEASSPDTNADETGVDWSEEDDRQLVELVLDKLRLSRRAWDECARQLGADQRSLSMRWRFLLDEGQVGLRLRRSAGCRVRGKVQGLWE